MNPRVELINTGTELLLGSVVNTHLKFIAEALFPLGLRIERQVTVPDGHAIAEAMEESFGRADIVLVTGGLGPTTDDVTRDVVAELLGLQLVHDSSVMSAIEARFARRGFVLSSRVALQALRPPEAIVLANAHGTAPGLYLPPLPRAGSEQLSPHIFLLPGPPRELKPMVTDSVLPILMALLPESPTQIKRVFRIVGVGESHVEALIGEDLLRLGIELGYCARPGEVDVRIIGERDLLDRAERLILEKLASHVVSRDDRSLEQVVVARLIERGQTVGIAESCTGGFVAHHLTNVPGASQVFLAGFVTYANESKSRQLGVDPALILQHGAVSAQVALAMAEGAVAVAGVDWAVSTTGIAGPGGGGEEKPVGTVFIALASRHGVQAVEHHNFPTDRESFKGLTARAALDLLRRHLE